MRGKLIVIEGTDCSGKQTQTELLLKRLNSEGKETVSFGFPNYDSPTGKIVGGPYLGKKEICEGYFPELAGNVNPRVASLYYAADRLYNIPIINDYIENGINVILDRYTYSNMGHQAGKFDTSEERSEMFEWLEELEFGLCKLPIPDVRILLYMPVSCTYEMKKNRVSLDQLESDENHLMAAEISYLQIAEQYNFTKINCFNGTIRTIEDIASELYEKVNI